MVIDRLQVLGEVLCVLSCAEELSRYKSGPI